MSDHTAKLEGTEELLANLARLNGEMHGTAALRAVNAGAIQIENRAKINAPVLTGALRNAANTTAKNTAEGAEAEIGFRGLKYARIQEFGGTVTAKGKYLKFRVNGQWVMKKSVTIKGKHYLSNAIDEEKGAAVNAMADVIRSYLGS